MPQLVALALGVIVALFPWIIGGNYPFVRTFASVMAAFLLTTTTFHNLVRKPAQPATSREATLIFTIIAAVLAYCALQTFVPGQVFSSQLPFASRERLSELLFGFGFFVFAYRFFQNDKYLAPFAAVVFINGALLAVFGIVQKLGWNGKLFWIYELVQGGIPFASFVNRNNAAGYLVICFAVANYFIAKLLNGADSEHAYKLDSLPPKRFTVQLRTAFENLEAKHLYLFSGVLLIGIAVVFSQSRGGTLALVAAFLTGGLILLKSNRIVIVAMLLFVVAGAGFVVYSDQSRVVTDRLQTLGDIQQAGTPRLEHWTTVIPYVTDYAMTGSGIGTYQYAYPRYQQTEFIDWFRHAENQFIETLAEIGFIGLAALLAMIYLLFRACISPKQSLNDQAIGIVGLMTLTGQIVAGCFDFGWYIPGNTVLFAIVMGLVLARHCVSTSATQDHGTLKVDSKILTLLTIVLLAANIWGAYELSAVDSRNLAAHGIRKFDPEHDAGELENFEELLGYALARHPDDAEAHFKMGQLHVLKYRVSAAQDLLDEFAKNEKTDLVESQGDSATSSEVNAGALSPADTPDEIADVVASRGPVEIEVQTITDIWPTTSIIALNRAAHVALQDTDNPQAYQELLDSNAIAHVRNAWASFQTAEEYCPLLYRTQFQLAQLSAIVDRAQSQRAHLESAISRCPINADLLYNAGLLEHHARNSGVASQYWGQVMQLTRRFDPQIILFARYELSMKDFFEVILPQEPQFLVNVANKYFGASEDSLPRKLLLNYTRGLLLNSGGTLGQPENQFLLASIESEFEEFDNSNKHFVNALAARGYEVGWRLAYARSLFAQQNLSEAVKQLKICLIQPGRSGAQTREIQKLLRRIEQQ